MQGCLVHRSGSLKGRVTDLAAEVTRIGRKPDNDVVLRDEVVSSHHAEIRRDGKRWYFVDLGSTNGSFVNGRRVRKVELRDFDGIQFGEDGPTCKFQLDASRGAEGPCIVPIGRDWESGTDAIPLTKPKLSIGRSRSNDVVVGRSGESIVSSRHAVLRLRSDVCEIADLDSANGTFVNGRRIRRATLQDGDRVELGPEGPAFEFRRSAGRAAPLPPASEEALYRKLEEAARGGRAGERTMLMLRAANRFHKRRRWPLIVVAGALLAAVVAVSYRYYGKSREIDRLRRAAEELFYETRTTRAQLLRLRDTLPPEEALNLRRKTAGEMESYDRILEELGLYRGKSEFEKAVMRLARELGETDLYIPGGFFETVRYWVDDWQRTKTLRTCLERANAAGIPARIRLFLDRRGLPREFLFIPLVESCYKTGSVGPPVGADNIIAKGMWQLIPPTAREYRLKVGPKANEPVEDPLDERHDELKSTDAAVRFLSDLYSSKAAASGLLVIAAYNFGGRRIGERLDALPPDPRQRNFWNFYRNNWLPEETRKYVMRIFAAALICENPALFTSGTAPACPLAP